MSLRKVCRELVLEVLLPGALSKSIDGDSGRLQLVVDTRSMRVLGSFLLMSDLHSEGVTSMELLERAREPLPALDALYFVRATGANVELIRGDFQASGPDEAGTVQHRHVHLAFSQMLTTELMEQLAEAQKLSQRVKSMVELPLSFVTVQDRGFHLDMPSALPALFPVPDPGVLIEVVHGLVDVCRCLQAEEVTIWHLHSKTCKEVAKRLDESLAHSPKRSGPSTVHGKGHIPCEVLIVDRSFDMASPLVHEYTYEAMVYDLLDGGVLDTDRNVVTLKSPDREMLLSEADALWEELKHMHLAEAQSTIDSRTKEVLSQSRGASPDQVTTSDLLGMVRDLPGQKDVIDRLNLHTFIAEQVNRKLDEEQLMQGGARHDPWGLLEQDIACGHDKNGKAVKSDKLHAELLKFFAERGDSVPSETRLRLLLLYLSCVAQVTEAVRQKLIAAAKLSADDQVVLMSMLQTQLADVPDHMSQKPGASCVHRVTDDQAACFKANAREEGRFMLSRFEPRVKLLVRQLLEGRLPEEEFLQQTGTASGHLAPPAGALRFAAHGIAPPAAAVDDWSFAAAAAPAAESAASGVTRRVLVFVLGGVTYSELRAVAELKRELPAGLEVVLGGTSILTARRLINSLRPARADEPQEGSARQHRASNFIQSALSLA